MTFDIECAVIGAGVVGLSVARALAQAGREVVVLEAEAAVGQGVSSRNSEVIHAGLYYPEGSLKARLCVVGKAALYDFCASHHVPHRRCGKIVVAAREAERPRLAEIQERAAANGVSDVEWLSAADLHSLEPALAGAVGLWSPSTGIIDTHALMVALSGDLERAGGSIALETPVLGGTSSGISICLETGGANPTRLIARTVVLAAGLMSPDLARCFDGVRPASVPNPSFAKGSYFGLAGRSPFSHLVYPVPEPGGLGIHLTIDMAGRAKFGPDVEWLDVSSAAEIDYRVDAARGAAFYAAVRSYWPDLRDGDLQPDYSGVRPKIVGPGRADADFAIQTAATHGMPGLVALYGIESPGLTASLAIGDFVAELIEREPAVL